MSIVAISTDSTRDTQHVAKITGDTFRVLSDPDAAIIGKLDLIDPFELRTVPVATPAAFLVDEAGIVRYHYVGRSPDDRPRTELLLLASERMTRRT